MKNLLRWNLCLLLAVVFPAMSFAQDSLHVNLQQALEIALNENPNIKIANRTIESKKYSKDEQIAALFPSISASGSYQRTVQKQKMTMSMNGQPMAIEVGTSNNYVAGLSLQLPLVAAPTWYNLKLSQLDIESALESARSSKISLINEVKKAYYGLLLAKDSYRVLQVSYANAEMTAQNVTIKYNQNMASEFEKLRADVNVQNQKPQLSSAENAVNLATMMLKVLIGVDVNEPMVFDGELADFENEMLSYQIPDAQTFSLTNNTNLKQLDIAKDQLDMSVKLLKASSCPTLVFTGNAQYMAMANDFKFSEYNWFPYSVVGLSLNVPIMSWVGTSYKIKEARLSIENLDEQKKYLENNLRVSVNNNLVSIRNAMADMQSNKETMMQAQRAYDIVQKQYDVGMATLLDLNSAELALTQSRLLYNQSIYNFLAAKTELETLNGNGQ